MDEEIVNNLKAGRVWKRVLFMFMFAVIYSLVEIVITAVVVFQVIYVLVTGNKHQRLLAFGGDLSSYMYQILQYLTFNSEEQPYPMGDWSPMVKLPSENDPS